MTHCYDGLFIYYTHYMSMYKYNTQLYEVVCRQPRRRLSLKYVRDDFDDDTVVSRWESTKWNGLAGGKTF